MVDSFFFCSVSIFDFLRRTSYWNLHFEVCLLINLSFSIMWQILYSYILFKRFYFGDKISLSIQWPIFFSNILFKRFYHSLPRKSDFPPQWQGFICWKINYICQAITFILSKFRQVLFRFLHVIGVESRNMP